MKEAEKKVGDSQSIISLEDFQAVSLEGPIESSKFATPHSLGNLYQESSNTSNSPVEKSVYSLLSQVLNMHFKPEDQAEPYGPLMVMGGRRSMIPDDLRGPQTQVLIDILPDIQSAPLRARLADIVWLNDKSQAQMAQLAVSSYCEVVEACSTGALEFKHNKFYESAKCLKRASQIVAMTGRKEPDLDRLDKASQIVLNQAIEEFEPYGFLQLAEARLSLDLENVSELIPHAERFAESTKDISASQDLWLLAARIYSLDENQQGKVDACRIKAAECYVKMAEAHGYKGMASASFLRDAIGALRQLPNTKERRHELEQMLRNAQASIPDEMGCVSAKQDITKIVDNTRKLIAGLTLPQAFAQFASLAVPQEPEALKAEVEELMKNNPISFLFPRITVDDEGKVVAESAGLNLDASNSEGVRQEIVRQSVFKRVFIVHAFIEPARTTIMAEHPLSKPHFEPLTELSWFVPPGHQEIYNMGFMRFFGGDFISALSILAPQLEASLRHVLKQYDVETSKIKTDLTQENLTLTQMLKADSECRTVLESIFGRAAIFEMENVFIFSGGPNVRHGVSHGLMSAGAFYSPDAIYACWFIFRLCCLPLFQHWEAVIKAYQRF